MMSVEKTVTITTPQRQLTNAEAIAAFRKARKLPTPLPMSYIESAYGRWNYGNDITQEWCSTLSNFVLNLRKYYQNDQCVVLYADVSEFWNNPNLDFHLR